MRNLSSVSEFLGTVRRHASCRTMISSDSDSDALGYVVERCILLLLAQKISYDVTGRVIRAIPVVELSQALLQKPSKTQSSVSSTNR